jgi:putative DNA primase/helicase
MRNRTDTGERVTRDLYEILGVTRDAPNDVVKKAYRRLAKQFHPDTHPDDPDAAAQFKEVQYAYDVLGDPERRRRYDVFGEGDRRSAKDIFDDLTRRVYAEEHVIPSPDDPMAVARAFIAECYQRPHHDLLRWQGGEFYGWNTACWPSIDDHALESEIYRWAEDALYAEKVGGFSVFKRWQPNRRKVADVFNALRAAVHLSINATPPAWIAKDDVPPASEIVVMRNGLLHVPSRTLLEHAPEFWVHHALPFDFDADAPKPARWLKFLKELWDDDDEAIGALRELFGYIVGGGTAQQKIFLLVGPKRSGKGTIGRVLTGLLGRHNVASPTLAGMATNFGLSPLIDKPLALVSDARLSGRTDASVVVERMLSISGQDILTVDRKYREPWTGYFPTRFIVLTNELPQLSDSSGAFASRFIAFVLTKSFYGHEDKTLTDQLLDEASGIFNWSLAGLDNLRDRGYFVQPASARETVDALEDLASPVAAFVADCCVVGPTYSILVDDLYRAWRKWSLDQGVEHVSTKELFGRDLHAAVPSLRKRRAGTGHRTHCYDGIALSTPHTPEPP